MRRAGPHGDKQAAQRKQRWFGQCTDSILRLTRRHRRLPWLLHQQLRLLRKLLRVGKAKAPSHTCGRGRGALVQQWARQHAGWQPQAPGIP